MKSTFLLFAIVLFMSCSTTKNSKESMDKSQNTSMETKKMMEGGFLAGTISASTTQGDCPFTIKVDGDEGSYFLDPINLDESYKKDGEKIWFTYNGLRMMNRCDKASPISIKEIQKRAD